MGKVSKFAGLIGGLLSSAAPAAIIPAVGIKAEKPTKKDDESEEDFQKRLKEWEDGQDDDTSAETPMDTTEDSPEQPDDEAMKRCRDEGHAAGVVAERARWGGVLASPEAAGKPISAMSLLETDMTAAAIQKTLAALPAEAAGQRSTLASRHAEPTPAPAVDSPAADPQAKQPGKFAARVNQALENINGTKAA